MSELIIRPAFNDHVAVGDVVAPATGPWGVAANVSRVVIDAHNAGRRPQFATVAEESGIPFLVDPVTPLWQSEVAPDDKWADLPFGAAEPLQAVNFKDVGRLRDAAIDVIEFQIENGATCVIPPYPYVAHPDDPWFEVGLQFLVETVRYVDTHRPGLGVLPVLCAQLQSFGSEQNWSVGFDRFTSTAKEVDVETAALCLSPAGAGSDSYGKVMRLFRAALHVRDSGLRTLAWRQGVYGLGLVAAGLDGYETGIATGESTNVSGQQSRRRPRPAGKKKGGGGGGGMFVETLGRSIPRRAGQVLLGNVAMRPKVMCGSETCCPTVAASLDQAKQHAIRSRARMLEQVDSQPHPRWRLNQVARDAQSAVTLAKQATRVLADAGERVTVRHKNYEALARVAEELGHGEARPASA